MPTYDKTKFESYPHYLMNKPRETTKPVKPDAPFPNMTENNQKYYGLNGWDRIKNNMEFNVNTANNQQRNAMDISYDGDYLTANAYKISPQGDTINQQIFKKKAYSGRSQDGKFDYSLKNQATRGVGPIPEGNYYINPQNVQRYNPYLVGNAVDHIVGVLGQIHPKLKTGNRPGGTTSWGNGLIDIFPNEVEVDYNGNKVKRDNFTIHGGTKPGSAGCIDLLDNDDEFFDFIYNNKGDLDSVALKVDYSKFK